MEVIILLLRLIVSNAVGQLKLYPAKEVNLLPLRSTLVRAVIPLQPAKLLSLPFEKVRVGMAGL